MYVNSKYDNTNYDVPNASISSHRNQSLNENWKHYITRPLSEFSLGASASTVGRPKSESHINATNGKSSITTTKAVVNVPRNPNTSMAGNISTTSGKSRSSTVDMYAVSRRSAPNKDVRSERGIVYYKRSEPDAVSYQRSENIHDRGFQLEFNNFRKYYTAFLLCAINFTAAAVYIITSG